MTDTHIQKGKKGSSGSPILTTVGLQLIAIHHKGSEEGVKENLIERTPRSGSPSPPLGDESLS